MVGSSLAERLVGPEAHDGQAEWVDGQLIVLHVFAEDIGNAGRPSLPLEFGMIRRIGVHLLELDAGRIGRLTQVVKDDVLDDLRQSPYSARIEFEKVYTNPADHTELKRERWTASVTYVFRENVKNNELAVNPLGLTIVRFRADQAFS